VPILWDCKNVHTEASSWQSLLQHSVTTKIGVVAGDSCFSKAGPQDMQLLLLTPKGSVLKSNQEATGAQVNHQRAEAASQAAICVPQTSAHLGADVVQCELVLVGPARRVVARDGGRLADLLVAGLL
jgi:hypothetical protein